MNSQTLISYIDNQIELDAISLEIINECEKRYPYFQTAKLLKLKNLANVRSLRLAEELSENVAYFPDRKQMLLILDNEEFLWFKLLKKEISEKKTTETNENSFSLIEHFLAKVDNMFLPDHLPYESNKQGIITSVQEMDYLKILEDKPDLDACISEYPAQDEMIDAFINYDGTKEEFKDNLSLQTTSESLSSSEYEIKEDAFLTESLARIYIKQKKYSKALEIIKKLSLKYPEKNVYFADQIRFLEIIITNIKT